MATWTQESVSLGRGLQVNRHFRTTCGYTEALATDEEVVWSRVGTAYYWPTSAATTTVVSGDDADKGTPAAGTGARTVFLKGLDTNWAMIEETVTLNGTTPVTAANQYIRVNEAYVLTAGSGESNAGIIDIKHGANIIQSIPVGENRWSTAVHSVPAEHDALFAKLQISAGKNDDLRIRFKYRPFGGVVQTLHIEYINQSTLVLDPVVPKAFPAKSDIFVTAQKTSGTDGVCGIGLCIADIHYSTRVRGT